ncbi:MAG TPA: NAD-dependent malic enzyme [Kofleriaceae bacterium]|nr:NAD-dependent malic enzyme [Kofleriaceae bacterium]
MDDSNCGPKTVATTLRGQRLLCDALLNKGTAFTREERRALGLVGLLPDVVATIDEQVTKVHANILRKGDALEQYIGLAALQDRNEHLFYRLLLEHIEVFMPIVYTPTVGLACQQFSQIFRRGRGMWITPEHEGQVYEVLGNSPIADARLVVVTDGERILGLGDQGAGGMGIPIGKLALYTVAAGIHPGRTLPITLDVGTDHQALLRDPTYIGWRHPRCRGPRYEALVDEFVDAVKRRFPRALLQWEDFKKGNAMRLLARNRERILSFNDDIQGTAAVALGGVLAGVRATSRPLAEHRVVVLGAGAAGVGIANLIRDAMARAGVGAGDLAQRVAVLDSQGLLVEGRTYREGDEYKAEVQWPRELAVSHQLEGDSQLAAVVRAFRPTVLIGTSGQPGAFTEEIVRSMAAETARPIVFPLSNPTSKCEATPASLLAWTNGRALVATGSPFGPVNHNGSSRRIAQGNNVFVFPGIGLGALISNARVVSDSMFTAAAETLAAQVSPADIDQGVLFPNLADLRRITARIAAAVAREAVASGAAQPPAEGDQVEARIAASMWYPEYPRITAG